MKKCTLCLDGMLGFWHIFNHNTSGCSCWRWWNLFSVLIVVILLVGRAVVRGVALKEVISMVYLLATSTSR